MILSFNRMAGLILGVAFLLRLSSVLFIHPMDQAIFSDMSNYISIADMIEKGDWRVTHFFQPIGFPLIIYFAKQITSQWMLLLEILQVMASTATLWFMWKSATESFGQKVGIMSLALGTIHLHWIIFSGLALAETFFTFLLSVLCWVTIKLTKRMDMKYSFTWGILFILAFWLKGTHVFFAPLFILAYFWWKRIESVKPVLLPIIFTVSAGLLLHGFFTHNKIGKFQMSASAGGLNFVEGKCPIKNNSDSAGYSWLSPIYFQLDLLKEKKWDKPFTDSSYFMKEGFKCIAKDPLVMIQSLEGIAFLFIGNTMWPTNQFKTASWNRFFEFIFAIFAITGLVIYFRTLIPFDPSRIQEILIWVLPTLSIFLCVYVFKGELRLRMPYDVWIIPISVKGWRVLKNIRAT